MKPITHLSDSELLDRLKHLAAQWFNNTDILVLEELFRRYERAKTRIYENEDRTT